MNVDDLTLAIMLVGLVFKGLKLDIWFNGLVDDVNHL
jgi:hypothetical protein